jgi:hypothetical protein
MKQVRSFRFRYFLPIAQLFIDLLALILGVWHVEATRHRIKAHSLQKSDVIPVLFQESGAPGWDFKYDSQPIEQFGFIGVGNLPAMIVSSNLRPGALLMSFHGPLWDPAWFLIQELISFPIWFAIGVNLESRPPRFTRTVQWYLATRAAFTVFLLVPRVARPGTLVEMLFWVITAIYAIAVGIGWTRRKLFPATS